MFLCGDPGTGVHHLRNQTDGGFVDARCETRAIQHAQPVMSRLPLRHRLWAWQAVPFSYRLAFTPVLQQNLKAIGQVTGQHSEPYSMGHQSRRHEKVAYL